MKLKAGDVVQMKIGGPPLTVGDYCETGDYDGDLVGRPVVCRWFNLDDQLQTAVFDDAFLVVLERAPKPTVH